MLRNREMVETKLQRIAEKARKEDECRFTSLFHLMNEEMLRECFQELRKDAASGIDKVTKKEYGENLARPNALVGNCIGWRISIAGAQVYILNRGVAERPLG
ncbi:conserved hypothetical protein, partial [delta proteobacterium NaphS2]